MITVEDESFDSVLVMGPLYHLVSERGRAYCSISLQTDSTALWAVLAASLSPHILSFYGCSRMRV